MDGADMVGNELCLGKIRCTLQAYGKTVQAGPIGAGLRIVLDAVLAELLGDGRDDGRIQSAREQYAIRHIRH